jgi:hypothetical protein
MVSPPAAQQWSTQQLLVMAARLVQRSQDRALAGLGLSHTAVAALQGLTAGPQSQDQLAARFRPRAWARFWPGSRLPGSSPVSGIPQTAAELKLPSPPRGGLPWKTRTKPSRPTCPRKAH